MEIRNRLTVTRREGGEREGSSQGAGMNDPWTWATGWGLAVGAGGGAGQGRAMGENWDNCNRTTIKKRKKKLKKIGVQDTFLNLKEDVYKHAVANITVDGETLNPLSLTLGIRQGCCSHCCFSNWSKTSR